MNGFRAALALAAALLLSACYPPTTSHPVGTTVGLTLDPALTGLWENAVVANPDERGLYFHFLPTLDGKLTVLMVQSGDKPDADWNVVELTTVKLGANRFMNARLTMSDGKPDEGAPKGTIPLLYRIDAKDRMTLFLMDEKAVKAAILAGKIKGTIEKGDMGDAVITADPAALDKFMQTPAGLALFAKPTLLKKME
ncbi:MAG TPA: hypothetical protein VNU97_12635 [Rhizomicrobium sp.]|jgi:hypothetical protein|nr:hypothetical protein [Rhizomicrobium sp.]